MRKQTQNPRYPKTLLSLQNLEGGIYGNARHRGARPRHAGDPPWCRLRARDARRRLAGRRIVRAVRRHGARRGGRRRDRGRGGRGGGGGGRHPGLGATAPAARAPQTRRAPPTRRLNPRHPPKRTPMKASDHDHDSFPDASPRMRGDALILAGGVAKGAFAAGAVNALAQRTPLRVRRIVATSAGALTAVFLASAVRDGRDLGVAASELVGLWRSKATAADSFDVSPGASRRARGSRPTANSSRFSASTSGRREGDDPWNCVWSSPIRRARRATSAMARRRRSSTSPASAGARSTPKTGSKPSFARRARRQLFRSRFSPSRCPSEARASRASTAGSWTTRP